MAAPKSSDFLVDQVKLFSLNFSVHRTAHSWCERLKDDPAWQTAREVRRVLTEFQKALRQAQGRIYKTMSSLPQPDRPAHRSPPQTTHARTDPAARPGPQLRRVIPGRSTWERRRRFRTGATDVSAHCTSCH